MAGLHPAIAVLGYMPQSTTYLDCERCDGDSEECSTSDIGCQPVSADLHPVAATAGVKDGSSPALCIQFEYNVLSWHGLQGDDLGNFFMIR